MTDYSGPWCNIKLHDGKGIAVKGSRADVTRKLRESWLVELEDVYGATTTIGAAHVVRIDDGDSSASFTQFENR